MGDKAAAGLNKVFVTIKDTNKIAMAMVDQRLGAPAKNLTKQINDKLFQRFEFAGEAPRLVDHHHHHGGVYSDDGGTYFDSPQDEEIFKGVQALAKKYRLDARAAEEITALVEKYKEQEEEHEEAEPMPWMSMPQVRQRHGEKQPEVSVGWADIYLDLILVGVAFNGGLLLKHAFYLCHPHEEGHDHAPEPVVAGEGDEGDEWYQPQVIVTNLSHRLLTGDAGHHPPCVGLHIGVLHALAFAIPILGAWCKETVFDAQFDAENLCTRFFECMCYLLMILGASKSEDVDVLNHDKNFWYGLGISMLLIDIQWMVRYAQILFWHEEECARTAAGQRMKLLLPGTALYVMALVSTWLFVPDSSMMLVPSLLFAAGAAPNVYEWFLFATTSYKRALPYNHHYVLHRCQEIFMVLLGESVLQLVTSPMPIAGDSEYTEVELQSMFVAVQVLGFILTLTVMHSFIISNPTNPHEHVMGKPGSAKGALWLILFLAKAAAVWFVGIGIKLALYDVNAAADAFFAHDQRLLLGGACAACFLLSPLMKSLHEESFCHWLIEEFATVISAFTFIMWILNVAAMLCVTWLVLSPLDYIAVQAGLGLLHMVIGHSEWYVHRAEKKRMEEQQRAKELH